MNKLLYFLFFLIILFGCSKDELEYQNDFDKSFNTWVQFSKKNNNTYSYTSRISSSVGTTSNTTITVKNNQITKRAFKFIKIGSKTIPENGWTKQLAMEALQEIGYTEEEINSVFGNEILDKLQWVENKESLGNHGIPEQLMTLDQIYSKTKNDWIIKRDKATVYFETENNGLISTAGYIPEGCMDDCFTGIKIVEIKGLK